MLFDRVKSLYAILATAEFRHEATKNLQSCLQGP